MKKNHLILTLPRAVFIPKKTPFPIERKAAHVMIENEEFNGWIMVHAYVFKNIGRKDRIIKREAWIENSSTVLDVQRMIFIPRKEFYKSISQLSLYKYSFKQVVENLQSFRRYGRWL